MKKTRVMAFGTFDILHAGHENYLKKASELGDELIVVVARDRTTKSLKGKNPENSERQRLKAVQALPFVTKALLGHAEDKYHAIRKWHPDILALGYDQLVFTQQLPKLLIELKSKAHIVRLEPYQPTVYKSSLIKQRRDEGLQPIPTEDDEILSESTPTSSTPALQAELTLPHVASSLAPAQSGAGA